MITVTMPEWWVWVMAIWLASFVLESVLKGVIWLLDRKIKKLESK